VGVHGLRAEDAGGAGKQNGLRRSHLHARERPRRQDLRLLVIELFSLAGFRRSLALRSRDSVPGVSQPRSVSIRRLVVAPRLSADREEVVLGQAARDRPEDLPYLAGKVLRLLGDPTLLFRVEGLQDLRLEGPEGLEEPVCGRTRNDAAARRGGDLAQLEHFVGRK